jgi:hypothetical protein
MTKKSIMAREVVLLLVAVGLSLGLILPKTEALGGISDIFPPGVDQAKFAKLIPIFTGGLTSCGDSNTLIVAFNLFAKEKDFISSAISLFNDIVDEDKDKDVKETRQNPYVDSALTLLTSQNMTNLISSPELDELSESLNLTCIFNYPALSEQIMSSAQGMLNESEKIKAGYNSLDKLSYIIQAGLLMDFGSDIVPAFVGCGGNLKNLLQFTQALSFWVTGNRNYSPDQVGVIRDTDKLNPFWRQYLQRTPEEVNEELRCKEKYA